MGYRVFSVACALLLFLPIFGHAAGIQVRVDETGRKVFYNIPTRRTVLDSVALYYSQQAASYYSIIHDISTRYGVDPLLVKALIQVESNYNERAVSPKGARGLMQLMPATAYRYGVQQVFDPRQNIEGGVRYLKDLIQLFNSDFRLVLAAYNAGENVVSRLNDIPNYTETQNYVRRVLALYNGDATFTPFTGSARPRIVTYYRYSDEKGVFHYSAEPVPGVELTKVSFNY